jgi:hypothetical protein
VPNRITLFQSTNSPAARSSGDVNQSPQCMCFPLKCLGLNSEIEMAVPTPLFLGLMSDPFIDETLVDALRRARRDERVPQAMKTRHDCPRAAVQSPAEVVGYFVNGQVPSPILGFPVIFIDKRHLSF